MAKHTLRVVCSEKECNETRHYNYSSKKDYNEGYIRHKNYKCVRHSKPDTLLNPINNLIIITEQINKESEYQNLKGQMFWNGKDGFTYGNGYRAFSKDFPEGTILKVTAEIILPK